MHRASNRIGLDQRSKEPNKQSHTHIKNTHKLPQFIYIQRLSVFSLPAPLLFSLLFFSLSGPVGGSGVDFTLPDRSMEPIREERPNDYQRMVNEYDDGINSNHMVDTLPIEEDVSAMRSTVEQPSDEPNVIPKSVTKIETATTIPSASPPQQHAGTKRSFEAIESAIHQHQPAASSSAAVSSSSSSSAIPSMLPMPMLPPPLPSPTLTPQLHIDTNTAVAASAADATHSFSYRNSSSLALTGSARALISPPPVVDLTDDAPPDPDILQRQLTAYMNDESSEEDDDLSESDRNSDAESTLSSDDDTGRRHRSKRRRRQATHTNLHNPIMIHPFSNYPSSYSHPHADLEGLYSFQPSSNRNVHVPVLPSASYSPSMHQLPIRMHRVTTQRHQQPHQSNMTHMNEYHVPLAMHRDQPPPAASAAAISPFSAGAPWSSFCPCCYPSAPSDSPVSSSPPPLWLSDRLTSADLPGRFLVEFGTRRLFPHAGEADIVWHQPTQTVNIEWCEGTTSTGEDASGGGVNRYHESGLRVIGESIGFAGFEPPSRNTPHGVYHRYARADATQEHVLRIARMPTTHIQTHAPPPAPPAAASTSLAATSSPPPAASLAPSSTLYSAQSVNGVIQPHPLLMPMATAHDHDRRRLDSHDDLTRWHPHGMPALPSHPHAHPPSASIPSSSHHHTTHYLPHADLQRSAAQAWGITTTTTTTMMTTMGNDATHAADSALALTPPPVIAASAAAPTTTPASSSSTSFDLTSTSPFGSDSSSSSVVHQLPTMPIPTRFSPSTAHRRGAMDHGVILHAAAAAGRLEMMPPPAITRNIPIAAGTNGYTNGHTTNMNRAFDPFTFNVGPPLPRGPWLPQQEQQLHPPPQQRHHHLAYPSPHHVHTPFHSHLSHHYHHHHHHPPPPPHPHSHPLHHPHSPHPYHPYRFDHPPHHPLHPVDPLHSHPLPPPSSSHSHSLHHHFDDDFHMSRELLLRHFYQHHQEDESKGLTRSQIERFPTSIITEKDVTRNKKKNNNNDNKKKSDGKDDDSDDGDGGVDSDEGATCCVCLMPYECGESVRRLSCLHYCHTGCMDRWLQSSSTCPTCRFDLKTTQIQGMETTTSTTPTALPTPSSAAYHEYGTLLSPNRD